jgi:hypothetical protein
MVNFLTNRIIMAGLNKFQWQSLLGEMMQVLRPGGWLQCCEFRGSHFFSESKKMPDNCPLNEVPISELLN